MKEVEAGSWAWALAGGIGALAFYTAEMLKTRKEDPSVRFKRHVEKIEWVAGHLLYTGQAESKEEAFQRAALEIPYCAHARHVHHPRHKPASVLDLSEPHGEPHAL